MEINLVHVNIWLKEQNISMNSVRYDAHLRFSALDVVAAYRGIDRKHAHTVLQRLISNQSIPLAISWKKLTMELKKNLD